VFVSRVFMQLYCRKYACLFLNYGSLSAMIILRATNFKVDHLFGDFYMFSKPIYLLGQFVYMLLVTVYYFNILIK